MEYANYGIGILKFIVHLLCTHERLKFLEFFSEHFEIILLFFGSHTLYVFSNLNTSGSH